MNYKYEQYSSVDSWDFAELKDYETTTANDGSSGAADSTTTNSGVVNPNSMNTSSSRTINRSTKLAQKMRSSAPDSNIGSSLCIDRSCNTATRGSYNDVPVSLTGQVSVQGKYNTSNYDKQTSSSGVQNTSAYSDFETPENGYTW